MVVHTPNEFKQRNRLSKQMLAMQETERQLSNKMTFRIEPTVETILATKNKEMVSLATTWISFLLVPNGETISISFHYARSISMYAQCKYSKTNCVLSMKRVR